jgi:hypothetical protein
LMRPSHVILAKLVPAKAGSGNPRALEHLAT